MKNSSSAVNKTSKNAKQLNKFVLFTMLIQFIFSLTGSAILSLWTEFESEDAEYLYPDGQGSAANVLGQFFFNIAVWFVVLQNFVPISLLVTLEMINYFQATFIVWDITIYDEERDLPC